MKFWRGFEFSQQGVQLAIRDIVAPGMTCIDGGVFHGWFSVLMSRLVGLRGSVYSIEANPEVLPIALGNFTTAGCTNLMLIHRAVWRSSGEMLNLSQNAAGPGGSSLIALPSETTSFPVLTVSLDDFCARSAIAPDFIKLDIEGCEFEALQGAERVLKAHHPTLVLEQNTSDRRCVELLDEYGYQVIELETYQKGLINIFADPSTVRNILAIHHSKISKTPYNDLAVAASPHAILQPIVVGNGVWKTDPVHLSRGRYLMEFDIEACESMHGLQMAVVENDSRILAGTWAAQNTFLNEARVTPFHVDFASSISTQFQTLSGGIDAQVLTRATVTIWKVEPDFPTDSIYF